MTRPRRILTPTDFSESAEPAVRYALALGAALGAEVHALHAYLPPIYVLPEGALEPGIVPDEEVERAVRDRMEQFHETHGALRSARVVQGPTARCIVDAATELDADLIVMGTHGRTGLARMLVGSVAERVVRTSPVPVLTVPPTA